MKRLFHKTLNRNHPDYVTLNSLTKRLSTLIKEKTSVFFSNEFTEQLHKLKPSRDFFRNINAITNRKPKIPESILDHNDDIIVGDQNKANTFARHFANNLQNSLESVPRNLLLQ